MPPPNFDLVGCSWRSITPASKWSAVAAGAAGTSGAGPPSGTSALITTVHTRHRLTVVSFLAPHAGQRHFDPMVSRVGCQTTGLEPLTADLGLPSLSRVSLGCDDRTVDETDRPPGQAPAPHESTPRRRRWPLVVGAAAVVGVGSVAALAWIVTRANQPPPASVNDALRKFRSTSTTGAPGAASVVGPTAGVYLSTGSGTSKLSLQASATHLGPAMPTTVTRAGNRCWWVRVAYTSAHWQSWHYCVDANRLLDLGGDVHQRFDFTVFHYDSDVTSVCHPVDVVLRLDDVSGDRWTQSCGSGTGSGASHQAGAATYLGVTP